MHQASLVPPLRRAVPPVNGRVPFQIVINTNQTINLPQRRLVILPCCVMTRHPQGSANLSCCLCSARFAKPWLSRWPRADSKTEFRGRGGLSGHIGSGPVPRSLGEGFTFVGRFNHISGTMQRQSLGEVEWNHNRGLCATVTP